MNEQLKYQQTAAQIEKYTAEKGLYYGAQPDPNGDTSWAIALNNHQVTEEQSVLLQKQVAQLIGRYHQGSQRLLTQALNPAAITDNSSLQRLNKYLTAGVPEETQQLWAEAAAKGQSVFSSRPDIVIDHQGDFHAIEYNADGGADKGNTQGVNDYSRESLEEPMLGGNLARLFVEEIRNTHQQNDVVQVATVLPDGYRTEYDAQNSYFARMAHEIGQTHGVNWTTAKLSELYEDINGIYAVQNGRRVKIDVVDREFKLPGFTSGHDFAAERRLVQASLEGKVDMLGSVLPYGDKVLLSTVFDPEFHEAYEDLTGLQELHAASAVLDSDQQNYSFGQGLFTIDDIRELRPDFQMVLKRGGDTNGSTGSKGLLISQDLREEVRGDTWKRAIDTALAEPMTGGSFWIVQQFHESAQFPVTSMRNSRSKAKDYVVINRFAPYYVAGRNGFSLGNILVTAGTNEETIKKHWNNIHGLRQNSYQGVSVKG